MVQLTHFKRTSLVIPTVSDLADSLNTNALFVNFVLSVGVCPKLSLNLKIKIVLSGLLNIWNVKLFVLIYIFLYLSIFEQLHLLLILKHIFYFNTSLLLK